MSAAAAAWPPEAASPRPRERFAAPKSERFASRRGSTIRVVFWHAKGLAKGTRRGTLTGKGLKWNIPSHENVCLHYVSIECLSLC